MSEDGVGCAGVLLGPRTLLTQRGGFATLFKNVGDRTLRHGELVTVASTEENAVRLRQRCDDVAGAVHGEIEVGQEGWVVTSGIAQMLGLDEEAVMVGDLVFPADQAGRVRTAPRSSAGVGYCLAVRGKTLDVLLHFI